jgi:hypothetical protein
MREFDMLHEPGAEAIVEVPASESNTQEEALPMIITIAGIGMALGLAMGVAGAVIERRHRNRNHSDNSQHTGQNP